mmetsp:Transcript_35686/g.82945  ORF Transcript_35686/g.82945 Transcript_35686/m.82945 type:complete len:597 (-) Transcript_35686:123-1913(-)
MASGYGVRKSWEHEENSDSWQQDHKRKREKIERKEKERDRRTERKKHAWDTVEPEHPQQHAAEHRGQAQQQEPVPPQKAQNWREEVHEGIEDERDFSDDEEATQRKLAESRRRREAMMAKWVNKETAAPDEKGADEGGPPSAHAASKGEPTGADAAAQVEGAAPVTPDRNFKADEPAPVWKDDVQSYVLQAKKEEEATGDMFDTSDGADAALKGGLRQSTAISLTGASGDDWDDQEGYYLAKVGEVLDDRYVVFETKSGRGVFSNVVKAKDRRREGEPLVAIKIIRSNDMMKKAAEKEVEILQKLNTADKADRRHVVRLLETFYYRKHIFLVFECMWDDLRAAVKKYTKNRGMGLQAVTVFTKQLLVGVRHMHRCQIIHADIKPDNILISENNNIVKLCDFGTAVELKDITVSPYLMSRFYRPPEVILGCEYGTPVDIWALSCTLYEIFTGKTLLQGKTNNDQLKRIMDLKGKVPIKVIKKGAVWKQHFDENLDFKYEDTDKVTGDKVQRVLTDNNAKRDLKELILERVGPEKRQSQEREDQEYTKKSVHFSDLLDKMLALDPDKRLSAEDALKGHHFVAEKEPAVTARGSAERRR